MSQCHSEPDTYTGIIAIEEVDFIENMDELDPQIEKTKQHGFCMIFIWLFKVICAVFNINPSAPIPTYINSLLHTYTPGPIIIEPEPPEPLESDIIDREPDELPFFAHYEPHHINTSNIPFQPAWYYKRFFKIFKWRNTSKNKYHSHPNPLLAAVFNANYISYSEWAQFVGFCKKIDYPIASDEEDCEFLYNLLSNHKNRLEWYEKYIYRLNRDQNNIAKNNPHVEAGKENANFITLRLIKLLVVFPYIIKQNIREIFEGMDTCFGVSEMNAWIVALMKDSKFFMHFRVLNWLSMKIMRFLMMDCLQYKLNEKHFIVRQYGVLPDSIFMDEYLNKFFPDKRIGWVKINKNGKHSYFRFFEIDKNSDELQIKHICPTYWQKYYIGKYGLDTVMFSYNYETNGVFWEHDVGILLFKEEIILEMDGMSVGSCIDRDEDDDLFSVFGMRYNGIRYRNGFNKPSFSSVMRRNLGFLYFEDKNNVFYEALERLETKDCCDFVFVSCVPHQKNDDDVFYQKLIAFLMLQCCYEKYVNDGDESCYEYELLVAEIYNETDDKDKIVNEMNVLKKNEKIKKYFDPLINCRKKEVFEEVIKRRIVSIEKIENGKNKQYKKKKKNKYQHKQRNKRDLIVDGKVNEYMEEWIGKQKIKYRHYLTMVNDLGQYLRFDENIKSVRRRGSHAAIHFKKHIGAIPLIPRPHGKHGTSVSLYIVKKWLKQYISRDR